MGWGTQRQRSILLAILGTAETGVREWFVTASRLTVHRAENGTGMTGRAMADRKKCARRPFHAGIGRPSTGESRVMTRGSA